MVMSDKRDSKVKTVVKARAKAPKGGTKRKVAKAIQRPLTYKQIQDRLRAKRAEGLVDRTFRLNQSKAALQQELLEVSKEMRAIQYNAINGWSGWRVFVNKPVTTLRQYYNNAVKAQEKFGIGFSNLIMRFRSVNNPNQIEEFTIDANYMDSFEDFTERYNQILNGEIEGSDKFAQENRSLIYNLFDLVVTALGGAMDTDALLFKCHEFNKSGKCWQDVLNTLGFWPEEDLHDYDKFIGYCKGQNVDADVFANSFTVKKEVRTDLMKRDKIKIDINGKRNMLIKLTLEDIDLLPLYRYYKKTNNVIIYDSIKGHYDLIKGEFDFHEDVYMSMKYEVYKKIDGEYKLLFKPKEQNKVNVDIYGFQYHKKVKYIIFDYETVIDFLTQSCMKTYSLSFFVCDDELLESLDELEKEGEKEKIQEILDANSYCSIGYDCTKDLVKYICDNQEQTIFTLISFNGANFDNFLLLEYLLQHEKDSDTHYNIQKDKIFYNGNQLLNFYINQHNTFDLAKHLTGKRLKDLCEDFKIKCASKKEFNHEEAQELYNKGLLMSTLTNDKDYRRKLIDYNSYDVLSTGLLFWRYKQALRAIDITKEYGNDLHNRMTIGSIIYDIFEKWIKDKVYPDLKKKEILSEDEKMFAKLPLELYNDLQKVKIAGRVEVFADSRQMKRKTRKAKKQQRLSNRIFDKMVSLDICSLYPYVLAILDVYYPIGDYIETNEYIEDKIGFYYCDIDQSNLRKQNLPLIYAEKTKTENKWDSKNVLKNYFISSITINLLKKYNCDVTIHKGIYFPKQIKSCEMFGFLLDLMKAKNEQDTFKSNKDSQYNPALRNTFKLLMNAISGKIIEGLHLTKIVCGSIAKYSKDIQDPKIEKTSVIKLIGSNIFYSKKMSEESQINKQRPVYLGVMCYDYAKMYMYENAYSKIGFKNSVYTDTDALKCRHSDFIKWYEEYASKIIVRHWPEIEEIDARYKDHALYVSGSKVFGSFENELGDNNYFYAPQKKMWISCLVKDDKVENIKMGCKGVSPNSIVISNKYLYEELKQMSNEERAQYAKEHKEDVLYDEKTKTGKAFSFFESLANNGEAYVLCMAFNKVVKNSKQNVTKEDTDRFNNMSNKIKVNYTLKKIVVN